ncbi:MAG: hypothetical protein WDN46_19820 [Methylocella sp.]
MKIVLSLALASACLATASFVTSQQAKCQTGGIISIRDVFRLNYDGSLELFNETTPESAAASFAAPLSAEDSEICESLSYTMVIAPSLEKGSSIDPWQVAITPRGAVEVKGLNNVPPEEWRFFNALAERTKCLD